MSIWGTVHDHNPPKQCRPIAEQPLELRLLQALHPQLHPQAPGSPVERETRWQQLITNNQQRYRLLNADEASPSAKPVKAGSSPRKSKRPFGVNLIGHAFEVFGIGEDIRMAARALQAADVPCCVIHHPAGNGVSRTDSSLNPRSKWWTIRLQSCMHGGSDPCALAARNWLILASAIPSPAGPGKHNMARCLDAVAGCRR